MPLDEERKNAEDITRMRDYFLRRVDDLQHLVGLGVTQEELGRELTRLYQEIADVRDEVRLQIGTVREDVHRIIERMDEMQKIIMRKQGEMQRRIIAVQATALVIILGTIATFIGELLLHH